MKRRIILKLISVLFVLSSCKPHKVTDVSFKNSYDTIDVVFQRFFNSGYSDLYPTRLKLEKSITADTIFYYYYSTSDTLSRMHFQLSNVGLAIGEIPGYDLIDSFNLSINKTKTILYKYDFRDPDIDGATFLLLNREFGLIGISSYSWGNGLILDNYNGQKIDTSTINYLLDYNNHIFRPEKN